MKVSSYSVRLTYSTDDTGVSSTQVVEVPIRNASCDVSVLGAVVSERLQEVLDIHCGVSKQLREELVELRKEVKDITPKKRGPGRPKKTDQHNGQ